MAFNKNMLIKVVFLTEIQVNNKKKKWKIIPKNTINK